MSNIPYYLDKARSGYRLGNGSIQDGILKDGLWDPYKDYHMGTAGELCSSTYNITREDQDVVCEGILYTCCQCLEELLLSKEVVPVTIGRQDTRNSNRR